MASTPLFANVPKMAGHSFTTADTTGNVNIVTGGNSGSRITSLIFHNKAATAREAYVSLTDGTNVHRIAAVSVNNTGNTTQDMLTGIALPVDAHNNAYVQLPSNSWAIAVSLNATVGANADAVVVAMGADY